MCSKHIPITRSLPRAGCPAGPEGVFCSRGCCASALGCDSLDCLTRLWNSPRSGVCGYDGPDGCLTEEHWFSGVRLGDSSGAGGDTATARLRAAALAAACGGRQAERHDGGAGRLAEGKEEFLAAMQALCEPPDFLPGMAWEALGPASRTATAAVARKPAKKRPANKQPAKQKPAAKQPTAKQPAPKQRTTKPAGRPAATEAEAAKQIKAAALAAVPPGLKRQMGVLLSAQLPGMLRKASKQKVRQDLHGPALAAKRAAGKRKAAGAPGPPAKKGR